MRISDWSSDVCSSDLFNAGEQFFGYLKDSFDLLYGEGRAGQPKMLSVGLHCRLVGRPGRAAALARFLDYVMSHDGRSEEHTSELQSLMRISYAVFCLKKKNNNYRQNNQRIS